MNNLPTYWLCLGALTASLACGGGEDTTPPPEETAGNETPAPIEPEPEPYVEPEPEPEPSGPGQLHAVIRMLGEDQPGTIQVRSLAGDVVAEGNSGDTFDVPSGEYLVAAMLDESLLPGHDAREERSIVDPGETANVTFTYQVARVRIVVRRGNRPVNNWRLVVTREGSDHEVRLQPSADHQVVTPGRYSGTLTTGGSRIEVNGLIFQGGATMDVPVNVN